MLPRQAAPEAEDVGVSSGAARRERVKSRVTSPGWCGGLRLRSSARRPLPLLSKHHPHRCTAESEVTDALRASASGWAARLLSMPMTAVFCTRWSTAFGLFGKLAPPPVGSEMGGSEADRGAGGLRWGRQTASRWRLST